MTARILTMLVVAGLVLLVVFTGCGKKEEPKPAVQPQATTPPPPPPPAIASLTLAKGVDISWNAVTPVTEFKPSDRITVLVKTENIVPGSMLGVRWYYVKTNQLVKADSIGLKDSGSNSSTFFIERAKGWPAGEYRIDAALSGSTGKSASFSVK